jgi:colanic acid/amylovoran biosynthesis glycosyltransferase
MRTDMAASSRPTLFVVAINPLDLTASFVRPHVERLPANTVPIDGYVPAIGSRPILPADPLARLARKIERTLRRQPWEEEITLAYQRAFSVAGPAAVLAEFGPTAVRLIEPCRRAGVPLIAHFHGYDSSVRAVLDEHRDRYPRMFEFASAIIGVSRAMCAKLVALGAPPEKVHYSPYGVDCDRFRPADAAAAPPIAVAVGRLVEKKAPHLTILAFADVYRRNPSARLRIIGDGPLLGPCADLAAALGLGEAVTFLGALGHDVINEEMRGARCFVQHSVEAANGDCEGTPNSIIEAGASGLPVVATRHAGIPDVVIEGETGFLVDERDASGMARHLSQLLDDPALAGRMGRAAHQHVTSVLPIEKRLAHLWSIIEASIDGRPMPQATSAAPALQPALHS